MKLKNVLMTLVVLSGPVVAAGSPGSPTTADREWLKQQENLSEQLRQHPDKQLQQELEALAEISPEKRDTTLLIAPHCLHDFLDFNDFLALADDLVEAMDLGGILQVAAFHPQFQFDGTDVDDVSNCTNRTPYPTLHLLREDSIDKAVEALPEAEEIFERNIEVLEKLGKPGWDALDVGAHACPHMQQQQTKA